MSDDNSEYTALSRSSCPLTISGQGKWKSKGLEKFLWEREGGEGKQSPRKAMGQKLSDLIILGTPFERLRKTTNLGVY